MGRAYFLTGLPVGEVEDELIRWLDRIEDEEKDAVQGMAMRLSTRFLAPRRVSALFSSDGKGSAKAKIRVPENVVGRLYGARIRNTSDRSVEFSVDGLIVVDSPPILRDEADRTFSLPVGKDMVFEDELTAHPVLLHPQEWTFRIYTESAVGLEAELLWTPLRE